MKNIQENITRVKSLMNLLTEGSTNPNDWKVGEYYIQTRKGSNERNIIKITYKDESNISFDYVEYDEITKEEKETGSHDKILVSQVPTQVDGAIWEESNETVWNEITKSTTTQPTNTSNGQIPKLHPDQLSENYPYFVKDESLNILYDDKYYLSNSQKNKLDEKGNFKDGVIDIWYQSKDNLTVYIDVDLKNNFPTNTSWPNVFNILNTTTLYSNNLTGDAKLYYDIFIKNYINLIVSTLISLDDNLDIKSVTIETKLNDGKLFWSFRKDGNFSVSLDWGEEYNHKIENGKIVLTSKDGAVIPFDSNETKPTEEPKPTVEEVKYPTDTNFSSLPDDIYQDLILNKIPNVKIKSSSNQKLSSDNKTLESIDFILDIDGIEFSVNFSKSGLKLINNTTNKQVKPLWTDKELKYRDFNKTEKDSDNEWMKTQVQLKLESYVNRFKQLI
jgi:hypothetical protein